MCAVRMYVRTCATTVHVRHFGAHVRGKIRSAEDVRWLRVRKISPDQSIPDQSKTKRGRISILLSVDKCEFVWITSRDVDRVKFAGSPLVFSLLCLLGLEKRCYTSSEEIVLGAGGRRVTFLLLYISRFLTPNGKIKRIDDLVR